MNTDNHYKIGEYTGTIEDILARHNEPEYRHYPIHKERNRKILKKQEIEETINIRYYSIHALIQGIQVKEEEK